MLSVETVKQMNREQLIELAGKMNVAVHHKAKNETLVERILQEWGSRQMNQAKNDVAQKNDNPAPHTNTKQEVINAIGGLSSLDGFKIEFPDDGTVVFSYKGYSESINLSVPIKVIARQAQSVSKTKYFFRTAKNTDGNNVLMV